MATNRWGCGRKWPLYEMPAIEQFCLNRIWKKCQNQDYKRKPFSISNLIAERKIIVLRYQLGIIRRLVFRERYTAALCGNDAWFASQMNEKQQHQKPTILDKRLIIISIWCWPFWWWWLVHSLILTWILFLVNFPWIDLRVAFHWENGFDDLYIRWPASKTIRIEPNHHSYGWRYTHLRPNFLLSCDSCRLLCFSFFVIQ